MNKYVYRRYSPNYINYFRYEKNILLDVLGLKAKIEHVGSTAITGLGGKGIIDIVIGVNPSDLHKSKSKLVKSGYEYRAVASVPGRVFFRKDYVRKNKIRRVHIHLVNIEGKEWCQIIMFRDYLIKNPQALREYAQIKKQAVKTAKGNGRLYRNSKKDFIKKIIESN